jgi:hypothetical protein
MTYHDLDCSCGHTGYADCDLCACMPEPGGCTWEQTWGDQYGGGIDTCCKPALGNSRLCGSHGGNDLNVRISKLAHILRNALNLELTVAERAEYRRVLDKLFTPCK